MTRFVTSVFAVGLFCGAAMVTLPTPRITAATDEQSVLQTDREFVQAAAKDEKTRVAALLDTDFTWTDADGRTQTRTEILNSLPTPALGNETGADVKHRTYGAIGAVMSGRDKIYVLRIWAKRPAGWRLLVYHEVALGRQASAPAGPSVKDCENPCKTVPFSSPKPIASRPSIYRSKPASVLRLRRLYRRKCSISEMPW